MKSLRLVAAALAVLLPSCGEDVQPTYDLTIETPVSAAGEDPFATATVVQLQLGSAPPVETRVQPGRPFQLSLSGIDRSRTSYGALTVTALDAAQQIVAFGRTPEVELLNNSLGLTVFVQRPGTFGRMPIGADPPVADGFALAVPVPMTDRLRQTSTVLWGLGARYVPVGASQFGTVTNDELFVFDSYVQEALVGPAELGLLARTAPAAVVLATGKIVVFGGFSGVRRPTSGPWALSRLDRFTVARAGFSFSFNPPEPAADAADPAIARGRTRLAAIGNDVYAFGGEGDAGILSSIVRIDASAPAGVNAFQLLPVTLSAPRIGHTANVVAGPPVPPDGRLSTEVLVFGGANAGQPAADLFVPGTPPAIVPFAKDPGAARRDHAVLRLASGQLVFIGGRGADGQPLATSVLYDPATRSFAPGPITLATPRSDAVVFAIGGDVVVAGGWGPDGTLRADAEIFDSTMMFLPVGTTATVARAGAEALLQPNEAVLVVGGWEQGPADLRPSAAFEIYQPRRSR